jgi:hypothetical protein
LEKSKRAQDAALIRWNNISKTANLMQMHTENDANALQMHNECNANVMQVKESKLKEKRVEEKSNSHFVPPTVEQVLSYCIDRDNTVIASKFIDFYDSKGWMIGKNKMKDWKAAIRTWETKEPKKESPSSKDGRIVGAMPKRRDDFF